MKNAKSLHLLLPLFVAFSIYVVSCFPKPDFPEEPSITFKSIVKETGFDSLTLAKQDIVTISINFQDGDGDMGLNTEDTLPPFQEFLDAGKTMVNPDFTNYKARAERLINGKFEPFAGPSPTLGFNGRYPRLYEEGKSNPLEGVLNYRLIIRHNNIPPNLILRFIVSITDRALHPSNEIITDTIRLRTQ